ncbi:MAG: M1 family aminopeptidase [Jatrophihabitans sp.]|uniref:M1 family aminopeptidase n=1 Tax=Jatrophihabitans sp. TaxID=1932789 RepID=UPI0039135FA0
MTVAPRAGRAAPFATRAAALLGAGGLLLAACTSTTAGHGVARPPSSRSTSTSPSSPPSSGPSARRPDDCSTYAQPDPDRPRMSLNFRIAADHRTVHGAERILFRADRPVTELIFRLTANTKPTVEEGNKIVVTAASADHGAGRYRFSAANADPSTQGGLLHIPFGSTIPVGTAVTASVDFDLTLGRETFDRFGRSGAFAYFGSAQPLLAWERGYGWHTEDMLDFTAESATSEAMQVDLTVTAPARDVVIASGDPADPPTGATTRTWHSTIDAARDVSVAAGPFAVSDSHVNGVRVRVGAPNPAIRDALVPEFRRAILELAGFFGPFPFPSLSVARLPTQGGGIEYPSSILMLDGSRLVAVHETAHQWFYAMVGDSQALHPWLDEAFAEYAEQLVDDDQPHDGALHAPGTVDASTESYGADQNAYYFTTYNKGAAALHAAREAAGRAKWDAALKCYVAANAWRIANPKDLRAAIAKLPAGIAVLRSAGALT